MLFSKLRLVTFDSTGTLLKFADQPLKKYAEIASLYGVICDPKDLTKNFKNHWKTLSNDHPNYGRHTFGWENWWRQMVKLTFTDCNKDINEDKLLTIGNHLIEEYKTRSCWQITRGSLDLLSFLRHKGIVLGVISNFDPRLHTILENIKLKHYFKFILTSYEVGALKPDPEIFQEAIKASELKNLKSKECLHIGDSVEFDYVGAKQSGWNALVLVEDEKDKQNNRIDENHIFGNMFELHNYVFTNGDKNEEFIK